MKGKHSASVIFFHGVGDTGFGIMDWVRSVLGRDFNGKHINFIYPTAPVQKYTPFNGDDSTVWYDRVGMNGFEENEDSSSIARSYGLVRSLINDEVAKGVSAQRIIVGGFSQGGAMAMHTGYHVNPSLAGVFAHSSYLNHNSVVFDSLKSSSKGPELRMYHGTDDEVIEFQWGRQTFDKLKQMGVSGTFSTLNNVAHELDARALNDIENFILQKLP